MNTASQLRRTRQVPRRPLRRRQSVVRWDARAIADCLLPKADWKLEAKIRFGCARTERAKAIEQPAGEKMFRWLPMMVRMIRCEPPLANPAPSRSKIVYASVLTKKRNLRCVRGDAQECLHSYSVARDFLYRRHLVPATGDARRARRSTLLDLDYCSL